MDNLRPIPTALLATSMRNSKLLVAGAVCTTLAALALALILHPPRLAAQTAPRPRFQIVSLATGSGWVVLDVDQGEFEAWTSTDSGFTVVRGKFGSAVAPERRIFRAK